MVNKNNSSANTERFEKPVQPKASDTMDMDADSGESITPMGATPSTTISNQNLGLGSSTSGSSNVSDATSRLSKRSSSSSSSSSSAGSSESKSDEMSGSPSMSSDEIARRAKEYYGEASDWMRENQKAVLMAVGAVATFGLLFYWLGDRFRNRSSNSSFDRVA